MKHLSIFLLCLILLSCRESKVKTEYSNQVNKEFFQTQLLKSISNCEINNDTVKLKNNDGKLSQYRFTVKATNQIITLQINDTLFVKPSARFSVYFVLKDIHLNQLSFDYKSQFESNTFSLKKRIIDEGRCSISCFD